MVRGRAIDRDDRHLPWVEAAFHAIHRIHPIRIRESTAVEASCRGRGTLNLGFIGRVVGFLHSGIPLPPTRQNNEYAMVGAHLSGAIVGEAIGGVVGAASSAARA